MANNLWRGNTTTALVFDDSNLTEHNVRLFLEALDKCKKHYLSVLCQISYPEYFQDGNTIDDCPLLKESVEHNYKEYVQNISDKVVFLGWNRDYSVQDKMYKLLNNHLRGGAKDFIVQLVCDYTLFDMNKSAIPEITKEILPSKSRSKASPPVLQQKEETTNKEISYETNPQSPNTTENYSDQANEILDNVAASMDIVMG